METVLASLEMLQRLETPSRLEHFLHTVGKDDFTEEEEPQRRAEASVKAAPAPGTHTEVCPSQTEGPLLTAEGLRGPLCHMGVAVDTVLRAAPQSFCSKVSKLHLSRARMLDDHILKTRLSSFRRSPLCLLPFDYPLACCLPKQAWP